MRTWVSGPRKGNHGQTGGSCPPPTPAERAWCHRVCPRELENTKLSSRSSRLGRSELNFWGKQQHKIHSIPLGFCHRCSWLSMTYSVVGMGVAHLLCASTGACGWPCCAAVGGRQGCSGAGHAGVSPRATSTSVLHLCLSPTPSCHRSSSHWAVLSHTGISAPTPSLKRDREELVWPHVAYEAWPEQSLSPS